MNEYLLAFILIALPLSIKATNYILVAAAVAWIFDLARSKQKLSLKNDLATILVNIAPFAVMAISLAYCTDLRLGLHAIEKYLPFLAFPFLLINPARKNDSEFYTITFSLTILVITVICVGFGIWQLLFVPESDQVLLGDAYNRVPSKWNALSSTNLMRPFDINPIYMSLYVSFVIVSLALSTQVKRVIAVPAILFLIVFQVLIGSRIGLIAFIISGTILLFSLIKNSRVKWISLFSAGIVLAISLGINPILMKRYVTDVTYMAIPDDVSGWNAINLRFAIWKCSLETFSKSPYFGYGVASQGPEREACYQTYSFYGPFGTSLNSHNQYLEYALIGGVPLLVLFLIQLGYATYLYLKRSNLAALLFIVIFAVTCLGESVLETHKGIVFFSFFNLLFMMRPNGIEEAS